MCFLRARRPRSRVSALRHTVMTLAKTLRICCSMALTALAFITLLAPLSPACAAALARKPNIVFILADDLGYGDIGCYGQRQIQTPRIDRMAAEGKRFRQCYAGATVCAP